MNNDDGFLVSVAPSSLALNQVVPLAEHPAAVYLSSLNETSRRGMRYALNTIAMLLTSGQCDALSLDWAALRYKHTAAVRTVVINKYAPKTANNMLSGIRRVLKEALKLELIDAVDYARAVDFSNVKVLKNPRGRALSTAEIAALMQVCFNDDTPLGKRDAALIAILRGTGLRRTEAVNLDFRDVNLSTGEVGVRCGKGGKDRTVYLPKSALPVLERWINVRGIEPGSLLCHVNKAGRVVVRRLTSQSVLFLLEKRATEACVNAFSPHDFRRTFISDLLDAGVDLVTVQKLAGHEDPATTSRYDRRGEETKRRAVQALFIPAPLEN